MSNEERPRVVISDTKLTSLATERDVFGDDVELVHRTLRSVEEVIQADPAAIVADAGTPLPAAVFEACSALRVVVRAGIGVDTIDVTAAEANDVAVSNVPDYCIDEVSTHAVGLLASLLRGIPAASANTAGGGWDWQAGAPLSRPADLTLGVVGFGRIGRETVRKTIPLFDRVLVADPYVDDATIRDGGGEPAALEALLAASDALSLHVPLTAETRGLLDADAFEAIRSARPARADEGDAGASPEGVVLVNTARGGVVEADPLVSALEDGTVRAAGLDVLPEEPPPNDRLTGREDVVVTPHVAWYSEESKREVRRKAAEEVARVLGGRTQRYAVAPEADDGTEVDGN